VGTISGWEDLLESAESVLRSNEVSYEGRRVVIPHSEAYPYPFCWDTAFHVLALSRLRPEAARENVEALLTLQREDGMIPNSPSKDYDMDLRSQPPVIAYAALDYYKVTGDKVALRRWYGRLKKYVRWWGREGAIFKRINLISPLSGSRDSRDLAFKAICSTGLDNHPTYDFCEGRTFEIAGYYYIPGFDLLLSSTYALALESMAEIASILGEPGEAMEFEGGLRSVKEDYNRYLWDEEDGFYFPLTWQGVKVKVRSLQALTSLAAGIPDEERAKRVVEVFRREFMSEYGPLTISKRDPKFMSPQPPWLRSKDPYYWRGPIWAPLTVLSYIGLKRYGRSGLAGEVARAFLRAVNRSGFAEYFTPEGDVGGSKLKDFSWTAAAAAFFIKELEGH